MPEKTYYLNYGKGRHGYFRKTKFVLSFCDLKSSKTKAKFRLCTSHEPNRMQMRKILCSPLLAFDSAHVKYGVWTWPNYVFFSAYMVGWKVNSLNSEALEWRHDSDKTQTNKLEWWMILKISLKAKAGVSETLVKRKLRLHSLYFPQNSLTLTESSGNSAICILFLDFVRFAINYLYYDLLWYSVFTDVSSRHAHLLEQKKVFT